MARNDYTNIRSSQTRGADPPGTLLSPPQQQFDDVEDEEEDNDNTNTNDHNTRGEPQPMVLELDENSIKTLKGESFLSSQREEGSQITLHPLPQPQQEPHQQPLQQQLQQSNNRDDENGTNMSAEVASSASTVVARNDIAATESTANAGEVPLPLQQHQQLQRGNLKNQDELSLSLRSIPTATMDVPMSPSQVRHQRRLSQSSVATVVSKTRPTDAFGAYRVTKIRSPNTNQYKVMVPESVRPGTDFLVEIPEPDIDNETGSSNPNNRRVQVTCPMDIVPGDPNQNIIDIIVPVPASHWYHTLKIAQLTTSPTTSPRRGGENIPHVITDPSDQ